MRRYLSLGFLATVFAAVGPASAAECVEMIFFDARGGVVIPPQPVVGLMLAGNPVIMGNLPQHSSRKPGAAVACPKELVDNVAALFNASCPTEERRKKAAADSNTAIENINRGCANMAKALQPDPAATP